jgi:DNA-binding response OmpR family regulator
MCYRLCRVRIAGDPFARDMTQGYPTSILVVEDDPKIRTLLRRLFEGEGWRVSEAASREEVHSQLASSRFDLVTLDLMLGGDDGLTIARELRQGSKIPIVMVSGKGDTIDRVVGLELGADDYIAKPFHVREVLARVRAVLRRTEESTGPAAIVSAREAFGFGGYVVDLAKRELRAPDGAQIPLTTAEFGLLEVFVRNVNRVLSRDRLMDLLKGHEWTPLDRTIDNHVARLRKKIERDPENPLLIKTVRGVGYSFTADVVPVK